MTESRIYSRHPRILRGLFRVTLYELRTALWPPSHRRRFYRLGAGLLAVVLWLLIFRSVGAGVTVMIERVPGIETVIPRIVELFLSVLLFALFYSGVLVTLARVFLSDSLRLVGALPAAPRHFFWSYWVQVIVAAGWMPFAFGSAVLSGFGVAANTSATFHLAMVAGLLCFIVACATMSMIATTGIATLLPANRVRDMLVAFSLIALVGLFILIRTMRPERMIDRRGVRELTESLLSNQARASNYLPSDLLTDMLSPTLNGGTVNWSAAALLLLFTATLVGVGYTFFSVAFPRARSQAISVRAQWLQAEGWTARAIGWLTTLFPRPVAALARKDLLLLSRDATQWSQLLLIAGLMVIYLFNISAVPFDELHRLGTSRAQAADAIAMFNLVPAGFVLSAVALRFVYAAVSLEGRAVWIPMASPTGLAALVAAKVSVGLPLLILVGTILVAGTNRLVDASLGINALSFAGVVVMSFALTGLGAGLGMLQPNFRADHPTQVVTSVGGFVFMGLSVVFSTLFAASLAPAGWHLHRRALGVHTEELGVLLPVVALGIGLIGSLATAVVPLLFGASRLDEQGLEP